MVRYAIVANVGLAFVPVCPVLSTDCDSRNLLIILIVHCVGSQTGGRPAFYCSDVILVIITIIFIVTVRLINISKTQSTQFSMKLDLHMNVFSSRQKVTSKDKVLLLLVCVSSTITGQPQNSVFIRIV